MDIADFLSPVGLLTADLFPGQNIEAMVAAWLIQAEQHAAAAPTDRQAEAAEAWVYYRAYHNVWQRLSSNPASLSLDGTSYSMGQEQIAAYRSLWMQYQADFGQVMGVTQDHGAVSKVARTVATW